MEGITVFRRFSAIMVLSTSAYGVDGPQSGRPLREECRGILDRGLVRHHAGDLREGIHGNGSACILAGLASPCAGFDPGGSLSSNTAISFHQIHEPRGKRIHCEKVAPGVSAVDPDYIAKSFEVSQGTYVLLDDEEIESVKIASRKTPELVQIGGADAIDVLYYEKPYFVVPAGDLAHNVYIVLREVL